MKAAQVRLLQQEHQLHEQQMQQQHEFQLWRQQAIIDFLTQRCQSLESKLQAEQASPEPVKHANKRQKRPTLAAG